MADMRWVDFPDAALEVNGLAWFSETSPEVIRLPRRFEEVVRPEVWDLSRCPSGGRIRFSSDTTELSLRLDYATLGTGQNMCAVGKMGVAVYVDGRYWRSAWPTEAGVADYTLLEGLPREKRSYTLYLPLYHPVRVAAVGLDASARVTAPPPFAVPGPVAFYGSSITQGGCASQAGLSYQAILGRMLNVDFVNLGFSGEGRGEAEMAEAFAEIEASCFVVDFAQNCQSVEEMRANYGPFLETIRGRHKDTPIICISPIFATGEFFQKERRERLNAMREVVREAVAARRKGRDRHISIVEGTSLLSTADADAFVDGTHPNDLGFQRMAERLSGALRAALRLDEPRRRRGGADDVAREMEGEP